jgi:Glycosyltransferase 61
MLRNIRRMVRGPGSIRSVSFEQEVLCPAEFEELSSAIFLPGQIDKIQATASGTQLSTEIEHLKKRSVSHAPTIAYHIRDATLLNGSLYAGNLRHMVFEKESKSRSSGHSVHAILAKAALASTFLGAKYFGHWLKDDCLQYMLAEEYSKPLCLKHSYYQHAREYAQYFSQNWTPSESARIDHLIVFQDFGQNSLKRRRYETLRNRIEACMPSGKRTPLVYLRRGQTGAVRLIQNESEIMDVLSQRGFEIVDVSSTSLERLLSALLSAKLVVSIEGSHLAHCWPSVENPTSVLTLQPPDQFICVYRGTINCTLGNFGMVVGDGRRGHYSFSISDILRTIDLMLVRAA